MRIHEAIRCWGIASAVLLGSVFACPVSGQVSADDDVAGPVDLRPNFQQGRTARYQVWTNRRLVRIATFNGDARTAETRIALTGEVTWTVQDVNPDGSATCLMTIDWLTSDVTTADGKIQHSDSRQPGGDIEVMHKMLRAMTGVPLMFRVSADGLVETVKGTEAIRLAVGDGAPPIEDLDFIETASDLALVSAAPAAADPGHAWHTDFTWSHDLGTMDYATDFRLDSVEDLAGIPVATVTGRATLQLNPEEQDLPEGVPPPDIRLTHGSLTTQVMFDLLRHEAVGRNTVESRTIQVTMDLGQGRQIVTTATEEIHSQALRIDEQD